MTGVCLRIQRERYLHKGIKIMEITYLVREIT